MTGDLVSAKRYREKAEALRRILVEFQLDPPMFATPRERIERAEKLRADASLLDVQAMLAEKGAL